MKLVVVSDNHGDKEILEKIASIECDADYYFHCGDSCLEPELIRPFVQIKGNNDYYDVPVQRIFHDIDGHNILLIHGHRQIYFRSIDNLLYLAEQNECDIVLFGHTHQFFDEEFEGVRFINPGSCLYNRDDNNATYAVVMLEKGNIEVFKKYVNRS